MDTFEIKDEEINVEEIMDRIRENIKKRKECGVYKKDNYEEVEKVFSEISSTKERTPITSDIIYSNYDIRNNSYSISSHQPIVGNFLIKGRKLVHERSKGMLTLHSKSKVSLTII